MMMNKNNCKNTEDNLKKSKLKYINSNAIQENAKKNYPNMMKTLLPYKLNQFNLENKENQLEFNAKKLKLILKLPLKLKLKLKAEFNG